MSEGHFIEILPSIGKNLILAVVLLVAFSVLFRNIRNVFNTVLHTVPDFFTKYPNDIIIVSGSDSKDDFSEKCRLTCKKKNK